MYKDKEKQKESNRLAAKRYRVRRKGMTDEVINVIPDSNTSVIPAQSHNPMMVGYVPPKG